MFTFNDPFLRLAKDRAAELRRSSGTTRLERTRYPDGERRPRLPFHWANRA